LLRLPEPPVLTVSMRRAAGDGVLLHLLNASDQPQTAIIGSGLALIRAAWRCNLFGETVEGLPVRTGKVILDLPPRRVTAIWVG
jgi:hypothetical protein